MTLDFVVCDIGKKIFIGGQTYVALSRVRNLDSLYLCGFDPDSIQADEEAIAFDKKMQKQESKYETKILNDIISEYFQNGGTLSLK